MATILLVDDQPQSCEAAVEFLERAGHTVQESCDGWHALAALPAILPDVLIIDVRMPKMDGLAFLRALREDALGGRLPVIVMTGVSDPDLRWRVAELGVDRVFLKGDCDLIDLLKCVNRLVNPQEAEAPVLQHIIATGTVTQRTSSTVSAP